MLIVERLYSPAEAERIAAYDEEGIFVGKY